MTDFQTEKAVFSGKFSGSIDRQSAHFLNGGITIIIIIINTTITMILVVSVHYWTWGMFVQDELGLNVCIKYCLTLSTFPWVISWCIDFFFYFLLYQIDLQTVNMTARLLHKLSWQLLTKSLCVNAYLLGDGMNKSWIIELSLFFA